MFCGLCCNANDGHLSDKGEPIKFVIGDYILAPSTGEYDTWDNFQVHSKVKEVPDEFEIDLSDYTHPLDGDNNEKISAFGRRNGRMHQGVDLKATYNDTVYAVFDGKVRYAAYNTGGYGFIVVVRHYNGLETYYAHLSRLMVLPNDYVHSGQPVGMAGSTGRSSGVHLHFETRFCGIAIDPEKFINLKSCDTKFNTFLFKKGNK